jgi:hypothetical protein
VRNQATIQYWDRYERRADGRLFAQRNIEAFYVVDVLERPDGERVKSQLTKVGMLEDGAAPGMTVVEFLLGAAGGDPGAWGTFYRTSS